MEAITPKYEIEFIDEVPEGRDCEALIAMLTGFPLDEVAAVMPRQGEDGLYSREIRDIFLKLGFNTLPRFSKFDHQTPYPALLRCRVKDDNDGNWYAFAYCNGTVYEPGCGWWPLEEFSQVFPDLRIMSMLPVWIKTNT